MKLRALIVGTIALSCWNPLAQAGGRWAVGVNIGPPCYYHPWRPYGYGPYGYYGPYAPYPVYVSPPPVIVQPAPVIQTAPAPQPIYQAPAPTPVVANASPERQADIDHDLQLLSDGDENVRANAVLQLGRLKAQRAVDPLAATLAGDRSPAVRDAAARALGLIGSPQAMPALQQAAQADSDREVRHSAQFAIEVIQSR